MKIIIEIPPEFEVDYRRDKFNDFFKRVETDINCGSILLCGLWEQEIAEMFITAFRKSEEVNQQWKENQ